MMKSDSDDFINAPGYNPSNLIDGLCNFMKLRNDAQLARALGIGPPVISKIRKGSYSVTHRFLVHAHDLTGLSLDEIRKMGGIPKSNLSPKKKEDAHV